MFTHHGKRLSQNAVRAELNRAATAAGLGHVTTHQLRHTYATALINAGVSLQALMALLGHVSTEMSLRYAHLFDHTVRIEYDAPASRTRRAKWGQPPAGVELGPRRRRIVREAAAAGRPSVLAPEAGGPGRVQPRQPGTEPALADAVGGVRRADLDPLEHEMVRRIVGDREHLRHPDRAAGFEPVAEPTQPGRLGGEEERGRRRVGLREHGAAVGELDGVGPRDVAAVHRAARHDGRTERPVDRLCELRVHVTMVTRGRTTVRMMGWARRDSNPRSLRNWFTASSLWPLGYGPGAYSSRPSGNHFSRGRAAMPSFDVVSELDMQEVRNAVDQAAARDRHRFDFKGTDSVDRAQGEDDRAPHRERGPPHRAARRCSRRRW